MGPKPVINTFGFLDESGLLKSPKTDRFFALGFLKVEYPNALHKKIITLKRQMRYHEEFKFTKLNFWNLKFYEALVDLFFQTENLYFEVLIFDKQKIDIKTYHQDDQFKAYNAFVARLIADSLLEGEQVAVIADDVTTPKDDDFEKVVKKKVKMRLRRKALFGIIRAESHAFSEIQLVDVLLGSVAYAFKVKNRLIKINKKQNPKIRIVKQIQTSLGIPYLSESLTRKLPNKTQFVIREFGSPTKKDSALG